MISVTWCGRPSAFGVRYGFDSGAKADTACGPGWAKARSRCAPARCAGGKSRKAGSQLREQRKRGGKVNTINKRTVAVATDDRTSHIGRTDNATTKIGLTKAPTSLLECAVYISARRKLIHAMSLNTDRPINRAVVVGCAVSATRNYLKSHVSRTL